MKNTAGSAQPGAHTQRARLCRAARTLTPLTRSLSLTHTQTHTHTHSHAQPPLLHSRTAPGAPPGDTGTQRCCRRRAPLLQAPAGRLPAPLCHARTHGHTDTRAHGHGPAAHPQLLPLPRAALPQLQAPSHRRRWGAHAPTTHSPTPPKRGKKNTPAPPHGHAPTLGHGTGWHNKWQRQLRPAQRDTGNETKRPAPSPPVPLPVSPPHSHSHGPGRAWSSRPLRGSYLDAAGAALRAGSRSADPAASASPPPRRDRAPPTPPAPPVRYPRMKTKFFFFLF